VKMTGDHEDSYIVVGRVVGCRDRIPSGGYGGEDIAPL
jgi:hypothetical protein